MKIFTRLCAIIIACTAAACIAVGASAAEKTPAEKAKEYTVDSPYFDLRDIGAVTSVKNQLPLDTCWSFATMSAVESNLIMQGLADNTIDLSERHLLWFTAGAAVTDENDPLYGDESRVLGTEVYDMGGTMYDSLSTLSRWSGVQLEENAPYYTDKEMDALPEEQRYQSYAHLENSETFTSGEIDAIKEKLLTTGAVYAVYNSDSRFYNNRTYAHNSTSVFSNHAITIVGWNDDFSKNNFLSFYRPAQDGAWIVKNSWGEEWGDNGYFYLSYYDQSLRDIMSFEMGSDTNYGGIYQHDGSIGMQYDLYSANIKRFKKKNDLSAANVFTAKQNDSVSAVGFYTMDSNVDYTINIYTNVKDVPTSGTAVLTQNGKLARKGYHTIKLDKAVEIKKDTKFAVIVTFNGVADFVYDNNCAENGISFFTMDKVTKEASWDDMKNMDMGSPCIKAYTAYVPPVAENVKPEQDGNNVKVSWDEVEGADIYRVYYRVGNKYKRTASTKKTTATVKGLADPESTGFVVVARVNGVWSEYSKKDLVYITPDEPDYPLTLTAGDKKVTVKWDAVEGAESYRIYRYADGKYTTKTTTKTSYTYKKLENGKEYGFLLRVKKDGKWSDYKKSDLVFVTPNK